jgi:Flp pilus assembly protein TadG
MILSNQREGRRGNVVVLVAFLVTILVGVAAVAIDGGSLMDDVQKVQAAADSSALAAAEQLYKYWQTGNGYDVGNNAKNAALALAATNGYTNDGTDSLITPNDWTLGQSGGGGGGGNVTSVNHGIFIPPVTGDHVGQAGYVEVVIQYNQQRNFSRIYGTERIQVRARAVAEGGWRAGKAGILLLDPSASGALTAVGNATVNVVGAPLIVDSSSSTAISGSGSLSVSANQEVDITGVPGYTGVTISGTVKSGQPPVPDPLAYLPEPSSAGMTTYNKVNIAGPKVTIIDPGVYTGGISVSGQATLVMNPGIYIMDGGGFSFTGLGSLSAIGVMIVNRPSKSSDIVNINGSGAINLSPMMTGLYRGISIWQDRASTNQLNITGNGGSQITGTFYAAHGTLNVSGNGTQDVLGSQYISYDMKVNGNGAFYVNWDPNLVGRTRIIRLVE